MHTAGTLAIIIMNWSEYENKVFEILGSYYPNSTIEKDYKKIGKYSKRSRQIDIYIETEIAGNNIIIVVDCKHYNKKINVKTVESFIAMADDLQSDIALMISEKGYSKTALKRAHYNPKHVELDILNLNELKSLQGFSAIPFSGENGAIMKAPFGWIIDAKRRQDTACFMYQRGYTLKEAAENKEFGYINFWDKKLDNLNVEELSEMQVENISKDHKINKIEYPDTIKRDDASTKLRIVWLDKYPFVEITCFVEFEKFIFFSVWFSEEIVLKRNIRKIETLMKSVLPASIIHNNNG